MKKITHFLFLITSLAIMMNACRKDESSDTDSSTTTNAAQVNATISGMVTDENNQPVIGAQVSTGGLSTSTDHYGIFLLKGNVTKGRCVIQITKAGFLNRSHAFIPKESIVNYIRIVMDDEPAAQIISASTGGTVSLTSGGSIQFAANSFVINGSSVPYTGTVNVMAHHLAPGSSNFGLMIPGGDLAGKNTAGDDVSLYSFGMTGATLKGSGGEDLQLAAGTTATITFPIAASQLGAAPATIPLWYLDEETALWKEEGTATKVGNNYVGTLAHFSWWNCDQPYDIATITGRVVDCEGMPLANIIVTVNGGMTLMTDGNGYYTNWVPAGLALTFQVLPQGGILLPSQLENVAALSSGQNFIVPDLVVPCGSYIIGNIEDCNDQATEGWVAIYQNGIVQSSVFTTSGAFRLLAPSSTALTLYCGSVSGILIQTVTSVGQSDSLDAGSIHLCNVTQSPFSFVLHGQGYDHVQVYTYYVSTSSAHYRPTWDNTNCNLNGTSNLGESEISLNFEGNQPVSLDVTASLDSSFYIWIGNYYFFPKPGANNHFYVDVTQYGNVGDSIKGTFHGQLVTWTDTIGIMVTDGKFAFLRGQDQ